MFYTPSTITIAKGQEISGIISCAPNARNNRDLDISISYAVANGEEENPEEVTVDYKMCVLHSCPIPSTPICGCNDCTLTGDRSWSTNNSPTSAFTLRCAVINIPHIPSFTCNPLDWTTGINLDTLASQPIWPSFCVTHICIKLIVVCCIIRLHHLNFQCVSYVGHQNNRLSWLYRFCDNVNKYQFVRQQTRAFWLNSNVWPAWCCLRSHHSYPQQLHSNS